MIDDEYLYSILCFVIMVFVFLLGITAVAKSIMGYGEIGFIELGIVFGLVSCMTVGSMVYLKLIRTMLHKYKKQESENDFGVSQSDEKIEDELKQKWLNN